MEKVPDDLLRKYNLNKCDRWKVRLFAIKWKLAKLLGGKCARCSELDLRALCFHHKLGGMESDTWRRMSRRQRYNHIRAIVESGRPEDVEVLCMNCHTVEFNSLKLGDRFGEFFVDIKLRFMKIKKWSKATELPDGLKLID